MTTNDQSNPEVVIAEIDEEGAVEGDLSALLGGSASFGEAATDMASDVAAAAPASKLEQTLAKVDKTKELSVKSPEEDHFRFRSLLTDKQVADLKKGAPLVAERFVGDVNQVMAFGEGTIAKLKATSRQMLEAQKAVEIPQADELVNDLLRELDGFQKKYRNARFEDFGKKILGLFKSAKYSVTTLNREMKPIEDKLDMAELKLEEMDSQLADNVRRGQILHQQTLEQMNDVVLVLASLEEIIEVIRKDYREADALLVDATATGKDQVEYKGKLIPINELQEIQAQLSMVLSESEKTWYDWRQQFFLGWANAPATRNLTLSTFALRRRLKVFKDMGIQSGRQALVTWKQAIEARQGAEMGNNVQEATNRLIQSAYAEVADTTKMIADASQAPMVTEETVLSVIDSVKQQARSIVEADRQGRALRAKNVAALERGEVQIQDEVLTMQVQLAENARNDRGLEGGGTGSAKAISASSTNAGEDLLGNLGG